MERDRGEVKDGTTLSSAELGQLGQLQQLQQLQKQMVQQKIRDIIEKNRGMRNDWDRF